MRAGFKTGCGLRRASMGRLKFGLGSSSGASRSRTGCGPVRIAQCGRRPVAAAACTAMWASVPSAAVEASGTNSPRKGRALNGRSSARPGGAANAGLPAWRGTRARRPCAASNEGAGSDHNGRREGLRTGLPGSTSADPPTGNRLASGLVFVRRGATQRGAAAGIGPAPPRGRRNPSAAQAEIGTRLASLRLGACRGVSSRSNTRTVAVGRPEAPTKPLAIGTGRHRTTQPGCRGSAPGSSRLGGAEGVRLECGGRNEHTAAGNGASVVCLACLAASPRAGPSGISNARPSVRPGRTAASQRPDSSVRGEMCSWQRGDLTAAAASTGPIPRGRGAAKTRKQPGRAGASRSRTPAGTARATASRRAGSGGGRRPWGGREAMGHPPAQPAGRAPPAARTSNCAGAGPGSMTCRNERGGSKGSRAAGRALGAKGVSRSTKGGPPAPRTVLPAAPRARTCRS